MAKNSINVPKNWAIGIGSVALVGLLAGAFAWGSLTAPHGTTPAGSGTTSAGTKPSHSPSPTTTSGQAPFVAGTAFPFHTAVDTLAGHSTTLARGTKATVVMAMASWCLYCGYEDKWVMPVLAKTPGVVIDIVDVSSRGGIADPGPQSPAFSGHDGTGGPLTTAGMRTVMQQYKKTFGTLNASNIHVYVAPSATQSAWNIQTFPTIAWINAAGHVVNAAPGAMTVPAAQATLQHVLKQ